MSSVTTDRIDGLTTSVAIKPSVVAATTANITLSGLQTIDTVTVASGERVLVKDQAVASENGIYLASTGAWTRALDFNGNRDVVNGTLVLDTNSLNFFRVTTTNPITIGTSSLTFATVNGAFTGTYLANAIGAVSRSLQGWQDEQRISVKNFAAAGDGTTDDTTAIQAAIDHAATTTGGTVYFPQGDYKITSTLVISESNIRLVGEGSGGVFLSSKADQRTNAATRILWDSMVTGDIMIQFNSDPLDGGTEAIKSGGGIQGIFVDGNEVATRGVDIVSWQNMYCYDVFVEACTSRLWNFDILDNGTTGSTAATQHSVFDRCYARVKNLTGNTAIGFHLSGHDNGQAGNTSYCYFYNCRSEMYDGDSFVFANTDNCHLINSKITIQGTGNGLVFHADDTGPESPGRNTLARFNRVDGCEIDAPVVAKATVGGSDNSFGNHLGYSASNNSPQVTIEAGAKLSVMRNGGASNTEANAGLIITGRQVWGARVSRDSVQNVTSGSTATVAWTNEDYDDAAIVDLGTDNTVLVVPNGIYAVELFFGVEFAANATGYRWARLEKDTGGGFLEFADGVRATAPANDAGISTTLMASTGPIAVEPADEFRVRVHQTSGGGLNVVNGNYTYFMMKLL